MIYNSIEPTTVVSSLLVVGFFVLLEEVVSSDFFAECEAHSSDAKRYLMKESRNNVFCERWKIYVPPSLKGLIDKGGGDYDAIG